MASADSGSKMPQCIVNHGKAIMQERIAFAVQHRMPLDLDLLAVPAQIDALFQVNAHSLFLRLVHMTCE